MLEAFHVTVALGPTKELEPSVKLWMDMLPLVAFVTSPAGATLYVNEPYQAYTGLPVEALVGDGWAPLIHPDDRDQVLATWMGALIVEAAYEVEFRFRGADGCYRWFKARALPHRAADGCIEYWLGICTDVHDLKVAEVGAQDAEEWFRLAQQASGVGTFEWDPITEELRWSAECKALFGFPPETTITDDLFFSRVHLDDRATVAAAIERAFDPEGAGKYQSKFRTLWPDGTLRWVDARGRAIFEQVAGLRRAVRFIGTVVDMTDAKRTEEALTRRNQELQSLANSAPVMIWVATPDGAVRYLNDQWYLYTGQTPDEALGNGWTRVLHPGDARALAVAGAAALASGIPYEVVCRYLRSDGVYRRQLVRAEPMRDADGTVTAWVGTSTDIDGYAQIVAELQDTNGPRAPEPSGLRGQARAWAPGVEVT